MPSDTEITLPHLSRPVGVPKAPILIDVRTVEHYETGPQILPTAERRDADLSELHLRAS